MTASVKIHISASEVDVEFQGTVGVLQNPTCMGQICELINIVRSSFMIPSVDPSELQAVLEAQQEQSLMFEGEPLMEERGYRIADNEENRENSFWSKYIGKEVVITRKNKLEEASYWNGYLVEEDMPFADLRENRFEKIE